MKRHDHEKSPLLADSCSGTASANLALTSSILVIFAIVPGTHFATVLFPAFEADQTLEWKASATTFVATFSPIAEALGALVLSSLVDHFSVGIMLTFNAGFMCLMMVCEILSPSTSALVTYILFGSFVKGGILWPAVCSLTGARISHSLHDVSFLLCAGSSRSASLAKALALGTLMTALELSWRQAVCVLLLELVIILLLAFASFPPNVSPDAQTIEPNEAPHAQAIEKESSLASKSWKLFASPGAWLVLLATTTANCFWSFDSYTSVLFSGLYDFTPGQAAGLAGAGPAGMLCGIIFAVAFSSAFGVKCGRVVHILQVFVGTVALGALAIWPHTSPRNGVILIALGAFGAVVPSYIPCLVFSAGSPRGERAFRLGILWSVGTLFQVLASYTFGKLREVLDDVEAWTRMSCGTTAFSLAISLSAMACLYWRADEWSRESDTPKAFGPDCDS